MKPYYDRDGITIYHADCRDVLPTLVASSVDLVLTDPPYGIGKAEWDHDVFPMLTDTANLTSPLLSERGVCFWFSSIALLPQTLEATKAIPYKWLFVWYAPNNMQHGAIGFAKYAPALVLSHGSPFRQMQDLRSTASPCFPIEKQPHPTMKPLPLIRYIADKASGEDGLILDPFMGSGTTLRAAKDLGRRAIGIEIEERYCEIAVRRLQQEVLPLEGIA